jgi:hypothetical protein
MKIRTPLRFTISAVLLLLLFSTVGRTQEPPQGSAPHLIPSGRATLYPDVMCVGCIVPQWDRGYVLHHEIEKNADPEHPMVAVFDRDGKRVLDGRIWAPGFASVTVRRLGATHGGGVLASAGGITTDGLVEHFIARTDSSGRTTQAVRTHQFLVQQLCEASDGTVWALGYNWDRSEPADSNVLRHYSFERGLLGSFLALDSISKASDAVLLIESPSSSYLRCGKDRVSLYFPSTADYVEVDSSTEKLVRWRVGPSSLTRDKATGFAVTEGGRIFASFVSVHDTFCDSSLYELKPESGSFVVTLMPVDGASAVRNVNDDPPDGTFYRLWGADGDQLVVNRQGDRWGLSWASVRP